MTEKLSLVLLPGLDGTGSSFYSFLPHLPSSITPIVISYPQDKVLGYEELLPLVLRSLPDSPFVLLGESFAGPLALMAAAAHPPGLRALILCATFMRNPIRFQPEWLRHFVHPFLFHFYSHFARAKANFRGYSTPELRADYIKSMSEIRPAVIAGRVRSALQAAVERQLTSCHVPILYIRGNRDRLIRRHNMTDMQKCRPAMQTAQIPAGHAVLQSRPEESMAEILSFLSKLPCY